MDNAANIQCIGVMSGSSCDGLDLACCRFNDVHGELKMQFIKGATAGIDEKLRKRIMASNLSSEELVKLDRDFAVFIASRINKWLLDENLFANLICSHGHTIFHQPNNRFGFQIGSGAVIAALTGIDTVSDFRSSDLALGGQGAPLVPVGEQLLYPGYDAWINLGGIANISIKNQNRMIAMDIGPCNMVLNHYAALANMDYDDEGQLASSGTVRPDILEKLQSLDYFAKAGSKSLGREWIYENYIPLIEIFDNSLQDKLASTCAHLAFELQKILNHHKLDVAGKKILLSGGGVFNTYLLSQLKSGLKAELLVPDRDTIQFKEAIIFALLGLKRKLGQINVLSSVTGATRDHCAGRIDKGKI